MSRTFTWKILTHNLKWSKHEILLPQNLVDLQYVMARKYTKYKTKY